MQLTNRVIEFAVELKVELKKKETAKANYQTHFFCRANRREEEDSFPGNLKGR